MRFKHTNNSDKDFIALCESLDDFLNQIAGGEENRREYAKLNHLDNMDYVIIAYDGGTPVGCASFRKYDHKYAEVKRVFINPEYRGRGISVIMMKLLEEEAKSQGYRGLILESGKPLVAAMGLYRKLGYRVIQNYGVYKNMPDSVCMKKRLL